MDLNSVFDRLWNDYSGRNASVKKIHDLFSSDGEVVVNDHIAFRTLDYDNMNIDIVARIFTSQGYVPEGQYVFKDKHLYARHFEYPEDERAPLVFISQLIMKECSPFVRDTFKDLIKKCDPGLFLSEELIFSGSLTTDLSYEIYRKLREESEYAAWFYVFGFRANHFTVSVNSLKKYDSINKVNELIKKNGFLLNSSGGEIKGTLDDRLQQSSTMADIVTVKFREGAFEIPSCYYEFAQRFPDQEGRLFKGFNASSANKIFESTNYYRKKKET